MIPSPPPPSIPVARLAIHTQLDTFAQTGDGKVQIGACPRKGKSSRACNVRITGPVAQKLRVVVTRLPDKDGDWQIQLRMRLRE